LDSQGASNHCGSRTITGVVASAVMFSASCAHSAPPLQLPHRYAVPLPSRNTVGSSPQGSRGWPSASLKGPSTEEEEATPVPLRLSPGLAFMAG
jgi:hypothetical protein